MEIAQFNGYPLADVASRARATTLEARATSIEAHVDTHGYIFTDINAATASANLIKVDNNKTGSDRFIITASNTGTSAQTLNIDSDFKYNHSNSTLSVKNEDISVKLKVSNETEINKLLAKGAATFKDDLHIDKNLEVLGNAGITGNVGITGAISVGGTAIIEKESTLKSSLQVNGDTTINNTLKVTGIGTFDNNVDIKGNLTASSNASITGTLSVGKATTLSSNVNIGGSLDAKGKITANTSASIQGNLSVALASTFNDNLNIKGNVTMNGYEKVGTATAGTLQIGSVILNYDNSIKALKFVFV